MNSHRTLLLGLGNDIMGDDAVGLLVAEAIAGLSVSDLDVVPTPESGFRVMELLEGYHKALILDSVVTGSAPPGSIHQYDQEAFSQPIAPSPHYSGMPEAFALAERLDLVFPREVVILAMEIERPIRFHVGLSPVIAQALPHYIERVREVLCAWGFYLPTS